jgi:hypothetical protein
MAAAQGTQARRSAVGLLAQRVGPCAGGIDRQPCAHRMPGARDAVAQQGAADLPFVAVQFIHAEVVDGHTTMLARLLQHAQYQPRIIGLRVVVADASAQAIAPDMRRHRDELVQVVIVARALPRHAVVDCKAQQH